MRGGGRRPSIGSGAASLRPGSLTSAATAVEVMLRDAAADVLAFASFPVGHRMKIWSTNPLERVNKEIKRRSTRALSTSRSAR
jgi:transposase-like protein